MKISEPVSDRPCMACPFCGGCQIHFGEVSVSVAPEDERLVDRFTFAAGFERNMGARYKPEIRRGVPITTRGGSVAIGFWCEDCGVAWREWLSFHKGQIFAGARILEAKVAREWSGYGSDEEEPYRVQHGQVVQFWNGGPVGVVQMRDPEEES